MVVQEASINNIMGGLEGAEGVKLHTHRRKLKQRFDIIKKLGQGTYGKVQLGINKETGQEVAIKTIKKAKIETEGDLIRIRREIQIMSSLRHPYIIHIYEVFENKDKIVLVMEYASGGELYDYLSQRKVLEDTEAQRLFRQIAMAVYYCHKHQICHRDLKLENILLDEEGNAKLADFGLSNVFDSNRLLSTFCGSPLYASPEIVSGIPYYGPEVDCWSLGVLLYTLVYGAMPFDGSNFKRLVKQISHGEYYEPKTPSSASGLIRSLLTVDGTERLDIIGVCSHTWLNSDENVAPCIKRALELSAEKPVRLDLLLSLNQPRNQPTTSSGDTSTEATSQKSTKPAVLKSHSLGSVPSTKLPTPAARTPVRLSDSKTDKENVPSEPSSSEQKTDESKTDQKNSDKVKKKVPAQSIASPEPSLSSADSSPTEPITVIPKVPDTPVKKPSKKIIKKPTKEPIIDEIAEVNTAPSETEKLPEKQASPKIESIKNEAQPETSKISQKVPTKVESVLPKITPSAKISDNSSKPIQNEVKTVKVATPKTVEVVENTSSTPVSSNISDYTPPMSPPPPVSKNQDFKLASTVHLDQLIKNEIGSEMEQMPPVDRIKKENALKVISHAISESAMSGERKSSTLPRRRLSRPEVMSSTPSVWRGAGPVTAPTMVANTRTSQFVYPTPAPRTSLAKEGTTSPGSQSSSVPRERIIPISVEGRDSNQHTPISTGPVQSSTAPGSVPITQPAPRQPARAPSLSREGSDSGSSVSSLSMKGEPVRKSPREVIIPIAVEGGGYVTPPLRESGDEAGPSTGGSAREVRGFGLASTRPPRSSVLDTQDSMSSDEDDDNFEILTAENLFSTLLSRVRSLTQRLNDDTGRTAGFPRLFSHESVFDNPSWSRRRGLLTQHRLGSSIADDPDSIINRTSRFTDELPSRINNDDISITSRPSRFSSATLPRARVTVHVPLVEKD